ncbi:hypothetical protein EIP86_011221 [Pleurotus ostreatoroseus]|nr:hypothetical protein EIP86_011221 [Pleurotus ostreatoroseus]
MSPIGNPAGNPASAPRTANYASGNSYSPQLPHPRSNVILQDLQLQQQQLRIQNQVFNLQPSAPAPQGYQSRPSIPHARTYHSPNPPSQPQSWPSAPTNVHTQAQATRRHTVDVPLNTNQSIQPRSQPSSLSAPTQQRLQQHVSAEAIMAAMAPSASSPTIVSSASTSRVAGQPVSAAVSNNTQSVSLMPSASNPAIAPQQQVNARPPPMSALPAGQQPQQLQQAQQQQPPLPPSDQSLAHARSVLSPLGRYLERAYISAQLAVAQEFDSLSLKFHGLQREKGGLEHIIKDRDAEISRLRRKALDWETKHKSLADECATLKDNVQQWLTSYHHQETQLRRVRADLETAQKVNKTLAQVMFQRGQTDVNGNTDLDPSVSASVNPADVKLVPLGAYTVPQALADALQSTITKTMTDQFEKQLAESGFLMLTNVAEKSKIENENALLKAHLIAQGIDLPSSVQQNAVSAAPRPKSEVQTAVVEPFVSPLTPPAEPAIPPRTLAAIAPPLKTPVDPPTAGNPLEQLRHEALHALLPTPTSTASPQNEITHIVKQETVDSFPFPWGQREIVDLTELLDSPDMISGPLAPLGLSLGTLEKHMQNPIDPVPPAMEQAQTVDQSFAAGPLTEEPTASTSTSIPTDTPGKKRDSMDANIEDDGPEARKKQRLETSEDVEMAEEQSGGVSAPEPGRNSSPPDFLAAAMRIETSTPQPPALASESPPDTSTQVAPHVEATGVEPPSSIGQAIDQPSVQNVPVTMAQETSVPDATSSETLSSMSISPPSTRPSTSLPDEQPPTATLPVSEPSSAMSIEFSSLDTAPPQLGNSTVIEVRVKQELNETALAALPPPRPSSSQSRATDVKFSLRHFELAYNTNGDRRTCRMCM